MPRDRTPMVALTPRKRMVRFTGSPLARTTMSVLNRWAWLRTMCRQVVFAVVTRSACSALSAFLSTTHGLKAKAAAAETAATQQSRRHGRWRRLSYQPARLLIHVELVQVRLDGVVD